MTALMFASENGHTDIVQILELPEKQGSLTSTCSTEASQKEVIQAMRPPKLNPTRVYLLRKQAYFILAPLQNETARSTHDGNSKEAPRIR